MGKKKEASFKRFASGGKTQRQALARIDPERQEGPVGDGLWRKADGAPGFRSRMRCTALLGLPTLLKCPLLGLQLSAQASPPRAAPLTQQLGWVSCAPAARLSAECSLGAGTAPVCDHGAQAQLRPGAQEP